MPPGASSTGGTGLAEVPGWVRSVARSLLVGVGVVDSSGTHLEEVLAVPRDGVGEVDDVENLWAAEAGDLHGTHAREARASTRPP